MVKFSGQGATWTRCNNSISGKYWTAEVFLDGYEKSSTAYMFSAEQPVI